MLSLRLWICRDVVVWLVLHLSQDAICYRASFIFAGVWHGGVARQLQG